MRRAMILGAMILGLVAATATGFANERTFEKEFEVGAAAELSLDSHKGSIRIRTHGQSVISVSARIYPDNGENPELVDLVEIKTRAGSDYVSIDVEYPNSKGSFGGLIGGQVTQPLVDFDIMIPDDASLRLDSHKSTFDVEAGSGEVEVESHKGTGTIRGVRNNLELETHKGRFTIEILQLADLALETHKGDIEVSIQGAYDFSISGDSHDGDLRFSGRDIPVEKEHDHHGVEVDYREGSGRNRIRLSTHDGTIELHFVD